MQSLATPCFRSQPISGLEVEKLAVACDKKTSKEINYKEEKLRMEEKENNGNCESAEQCNHAESENNKGKEYKVCGITKREVESEETSRKG